MFMDQTTREALDFQYIMNKLEVLTPYGVMFKSRMKPYTRGQEKLLENQLNILQSHIPFIRDNQLRRKFNNILGHMKDLRLSTKRAMDGFILTDVELFEIKSFLFLTRELVELMEENRMPQFPETRIDLLPRLERLLDPEDTKISTFYIYDAYSEELRALREQKRDKDRELKLMKKRLREQVGEDLNLDLRPDGSVVITKDRTELLETLKSYPYLTYVSETYLNIRFVIKPTEEMTLAERELLILRDREEREEMKIRESLSHEVGKRRRELFRNMLAIGKLDLILAKARLAVDMDAVKPIIIDNFRITIENGIHPKIAELLKSKKLSFTPVSVDLREGVACITGANMGGKTISLKMTGLLCAMAHHGMYVPAESMVLGLSNYIKSSIGDMQSTDSGLSTFGGEVRVVSEAMERADEEGLILIDELARGTNPEEGYAISKAIVKYLKDKPAISLITTHYDNVADMEGVQHLQVIGLSELNLDDLTEEIKYGDGMTIINKYMNYRLRVVDKSTPIPKDAINIARIMGLKKEILEIAEGIIGESGKGKV
ncbi:MutS-related protein [Gudongella oleilytica]|uniref:lysine 5,6-aminomutase reactivase ATPase KamC n=1 Tax=Gudongella oleilytica TaxID=1582259 RepID=UPI000FF88093|nr:DNA mismatch repair protein MutS [Gudongella oleilytica]